MIIFTLTAGLLYYLGSQQVLTWFVSFWLTIFLIISIVLFIWGILGWKKRQDNLDRLLSLEVSEKDILVRKLKLDAESKSLEQEESKRRIFEKVGSDLKKLPEKIV
jgi:biopolymer transport protein ExbB/TolQ